MIPTALVIFSTNNIPSRLTNIQPQLKILHRFWGELDIMKIKMIMTK